MIMTYDITYDECPCVPTVRCGRNVTDQDLRNMSAQLFTADTNNVFEYLDITPDSENPKRYFRMGSKHFPRDPRRDGSQ